MNEHALDTIRYTPKSYTIKWHGGVSMLKREEYVKPDYGKQIDLSPSEYKDIKNK